jgi:D-methionine transport system substrate-binding protein
MKKLITLGLALILVFAGVLFLNNDQGPDNDYKKIRVGATPVPHGELLNLIKDDLLKEGIELEIVEFTDYITPNIALNDGNIDANFFQHAPYLEAFSKEHQLNLKSIGSIHVEPLGLYSKKHKSVESLEEGSLIAIPSDAVNGGRALILLENNGLIELKANAGLEATEKDIVKNPNNLRFKAVEAAQLPRILEDVDGAIINGNYALEAGLSPKDEALILEDGQSPYANIVTVRSGDVNREVLKTLVKTLQSEKVKNFIEENYGGGVVEAFSIPDQALE